MGKKGTRGKLPFVQHGQPQGGQNVPTALKQSQQSQPPLNETASAKPPPHKQTDSSDARDREQSTGFVGQALLDALQQMQPTVQKPAHPLPKKPAKPTSAVTKKPEVPAQPSSLQATNNTRNLQPPPPLWTAKNTQQPVPAPLPYGQQYPIQQNVQYPAYGTGFPMPYPPPNFTQYIQPSFPAAYNHSHFFQQYAMPPHQQHTPYGNYSGPPGGGVRLNQQPPWSASNWRSPGGPTAEQHASKVQYDPLRAVQCYYGCQNWRINKTYRPSSSLNTSKWAYREERGTSDHSSSDGEKGQTVPIRKPPTGSREPQPRHQRGRTPNAASGAAPAVPWRKNVTKLPVPKPTAEYLTLAGMEPERLTKPQPLLVIMDLNGTLVHRPNRKSSPKNFVPRPSLQPFLTHLFANYHVVVWSSAQPANVLAMCENIFTPDQHGRVLARWARDTLGLDATQYYEKVQVYKQLTKIWADPALSTTHPAHAAGECWGQHNTVLIDDSALKAAAEPHNLVELPEFTGTPRQAQDDALLQVAGYLTELSWHRDVSAFMRRTPFKVHGGWYLEEPKKDVVVVGA